MQNPPNPGQQLLYQFQAYKEQRDILTEQTQFLNASLNNLINIKNTVENLKEVKEGEEILVPVGGMLNLKATIKDPKKVLLYISQDIVVEKSLEETLEHIDERIVTHNEQIQKVSTQLQNVERILQEISQNVQQNYPQP